MAGIFIEGKEYRIHMLNQFSRTQLLLGKKGIDRLAEAKVAVFGIGGVGGYVVEALARSGVDRKSTRLNSSHNVASRMPSSA